MNKKKPLDPKLLRLEVKPSELDFKTTKSLKPLNEFLGQKRAISALLFGVDIDSQGYNLYAMGPTGLGKRSLINSILSEHAKHLPAPLDWCYIYNFLEPEHPIAVSLPAGTALTFQKDMNDFVGELGPAILTVLESAEYRAKIKKINDYFEAERSKNDKKQVKTKIDKTPELYKAQHKKEAALQATAIATILKPYIKKLKYKYIKHRAILQYLNAVLKDVIQNVGEFVRQDSKTKLYQYHAEHDYLNNYKVNVLVNNLKRKGAPVVFEDSPSYSNLISRIEHKTVDGMLITNFTLIKAGALHRANGGYLIIEARKLVRHTEVWEALKNALYSQQIKIKIVESNSIKPVSLRPLPIPLDVKVILIGDRNTYYSLSQTDPDFNKLFKVPVDFDEEINKNKRSIHMYARLIATIIQRKQLLPFDASAVAAIINHSSRMTEDVEKLSTYFSELEDAVVESSYWANAANKKMVTAELVQNALDTRVDRMDRAQLLYYESIDRDFIVIRTSGNYVGQANCLSVRRVGNYAYGHPTRVTARVRAGKGMLVDIQREIDMAGPLHNKAGLIISNFLASRFSSDTPLALHASIAFEQLYCWTDGDSASVGELCALLSALADAPILHSLAVTGSIDQYGMVQAVGGVNEKIEGFFDVCVRRGLSGNQGVLIPAINVKNLMLKKDVQIAASKGQFHIYAIEDIDQAIELLTGERAKAVYLRVAERLSSFKKK